jgi:two-component system response regulator HydG
MPLDLQAKLLRALEQQELRPVGATQVVRFDARIVAATNRDPEAMVREGTFRRDLFYRLNVLTITVPSLRNRKEDIPLLAEYFLHRLAEDGGHRRHLSPKALDLLQSYHWPGNVRELQNYLRRAVALTDRSVIYISDFPEAIWNPPDTKSAVPRDEAVVPLRDLERHAILQALVAAGGDKAVAARRLGIGRATLYRRLRQYQEDLDIATQH